MKMYQKILQTILPEFSIPYHEGIRFEVYSRVLADRLMGIIVCDGQKIWICYNGGGPIGIGCPTYNLDLADPEFDIKLRKAFRL